MLAKGVTLKRDDPLIYSVIQLVMQGTQTTAC